MTTAWSHRTYKLGDESQIFELVKAVWEQEQQIPEKEQWIKGWRWMFADNPAGSSIIFLAEHNGKLVGEYPLVMADMKIGGRIAKAGQIADTMTHPKYRRQGIAFSLGGEALRQLKEQGALLAFGFPTDEAYLLHCKSGWLDICSIRLMIKPLNLRTMLERHLTRNKLLLDVLSAIGELALKIIFRAERTPQIDGLTITKLSYFDDRFNEFWERIAEDYNIIVVRNKSYLNWRYVDVPNASYDIYAAEKYGKICGYVILDRKYLRRLVFGRILDIIAPLHERKIVQCLISKAVEHFEKERVDAVISGIVANRYCKDFLKIGFIPSPRSKSRFIAYKTFADLPDGLLKNPENWFIQLGDLPMVY